MINRALDAITRADLDALVANRVTEGRTLEFKRDLPGGKDEEVKEFLADVTSLANTQGGDLIFGIEDDKGEATALPGVNVPDVDALLLRLENLLRDAVQPRLPVRMKWVTFSGPEGSLIIRVPSSVTSPHRVTYRGSGRFYHRNSRGKAEMDTHELRQAFTGTEELPRRLEELHRKAVNGVVERDLPFDLVTGPRAVLSVIPFSVFRDPRHLELSQERSVWPPFSSSIDWLHTLEGFLVFTVGDAETYAFALTHRAGYVDASWRIGRKREDERLIVWPYPVEATMRDLVRSAIEKLTSQGIEGPWMVALSLLGVKGFMLSFGEDWVQSGSKAAWRDVMHLPPVVLEEFSEDALMSIARTLFFGFGEERPTGKALGHGAR